MTSALVDSDVLIDVLGSATGTERAWSVAALKFAFESGPIILSPIVWAEVSGPFSSNAILRDALQRLQLMREDFPFEASHLAGMAHRSYLMRGGRRERTLPDFLIGAHAVFGGHQLVTRDPARYRICFPRLMVVGPDTHTMGLA